MMIPVVSVFHGHFALEKFSQASKVQEHDQHHDAMRLDTAARRTTLQLGFAVLHTTTILETPFSIFHVV